MFFSFYTILRVILHPFLTQLAPRLSKKMDERLKFEKRYPMIKVENDFDYAFEISSEGELEQVRYLIDLYLQQKMRLQILFSSPSVERQIISLKNTYSEQVCIAAVPIISFHPFFNNPIFWLKTSIFIMCRYDFFPELIKYGANRHVKFVLVSGSLNNYATKNPLVKKYLLWCYRSFDCIICNLKKDTDKFHSLTLRENTETYDFRVPQILKRLSLKETTLEDRFPSFNLLEALFQNYDKQRRLIFGSLWPADLALFNTKQILDGTRLLLIVPHDLNAENISTIKSFFKLKNMPVYELTHNLHSTDVEALITQSLIHPGVWLLNLKGVLCELYSFFGCAYVGGGFGVSVHSLLEPYLAGASVFCGPKTQRSSEFDFISENNEQSVFQSVSFDEISNRMIRRQQLIDSNFFLDEEYMRAQAVVQWINNFDRRSDATGSL